MTSRPIRSVIERSVGRRLSTLNFNYALSTIGYFGADAILAHIPAHDLTVDRNIETVEEITRVQNVLGKMFSAGTQFWK